ncbi:MAG: ABC transporter substrate-binding protein [Thermodesulfobacteriota bacterium]
MTIRKTFLLGLILLLGLPAAGPAAEPGITDTELTVGVSTPLTGPAALWGVTAQGFKAWADYLNDQGGLHGRKIKVIIKDDGYNPARSMANLQEMKDQVFCVGPLLGSAPCGASKDFWAEHKIPLITPYANVRIYADLPKDKQRWVFMSYPDYEDEAEYLTKYGVDKLGVKKIAMFYQNDDFGQMAMVGVKKAVGGLTGKAELVKAVPYEVTERALGTHALALKESGADTVIIYASPSHSALILKEQVKVAYKPKVLTNFTVGDPIMAKLAGEAWVGAFITLAGNIGMPGVDKEADKVVEILLKYNPDFKGKEYLAVFGAVSMMHLAEGLKNAGKGLTREGLIKGMESIKDWKPMGLGAPVTYGPDRHHGLNSSRMSQAQADGSNKPIADFVVYKSRF